LRKRAFALPRSIFPATIPRIKRVSAAVIAAKKFVRQTVATIAAESRLGTDRDRKFENGGCSFSVAQESAKQSKETRE
jgi:hypothetical protein